MMRPHTMARLLSIPLLVLAVLCGSAITASAATTTPPGMAPDVEAPQVANSFKFVWGAMGDSYGSGEGNPANAKSVPSDPTNYTGLKWSTNGNAYTPVAISGVSYQADTTTCHRSSNSPVNTVNDRIRTTFGVTTVLGHVACSGATMNNLLNAGYTGPNTIAASRMGFARISQPSQIDRIAAMKAAQGRLDAVYVSIGGNDTGFGDVLSNCLTPFSNCTSMSNATTAAVNSLATKYAALDSAMDQKLGSSTRVFISGYPNPLDKGNGAACAETDYDRYGETWLGGWDGSTAGEISRAEANWAYGIPGRINSQMSTAAVRAQNWLYVGAHVTASLGRGMCTVTPAFNLNSAALKKQGRDVDGTANYAYAAGFVHPNALGYSYYANAIYDAMLPTIKSKIYDGLITPQRLRTVGASATSIVVRWDDKATSENAYELTVTPSNSSDSSALPLPPGATRLGYGYRIRLNGSNVQTFTITTTRRIGVRVDVAACNLGLSPTQCATPTSYLYATNVVPATPTGVRYQVLAPLGRTATASWTATPGALDYVIRLTNRFTRAETFFRTTASPFTVTSPTSYTVDVAACNRAGCSAWAAVSR